MLDAVRPVERTFGSVSERRLFGKRMREGGEGEEGEEEDDEEDDEEDNEEEGEEGYEPVDEEVELND
eukprot:5371338-Prymnesium_polylepis.1